MITLGLVLICAAVGAVAFAPKLEPYARQAVAQQLGTLLGTKVEIGRIYPAWMEGGLALERVTIENPPNFKEGTAASCDRMLIQPEVFTVFSKSPTIACVTMEGAALKLRYKPGDGTNLGYFKKRALAAEDMLPLPGEGVLVKEVRAQGTRVDLVPGPTIDLDLRPIALGQLDLNSPAPGSAAKTVVGILQAVMLESASMKGMMQPLVDLLKIEGLPVDMKAVAAARAAEAAAAAAQAGAPAPAQSPAPAPAPMAQKSVDLEIPEI